MLQINTGRFFTRGVGRENLLRGILFTNLVLGYRDEGQIRNAAFGFLAQTSEIQSFPGSIVFEFTERIESDGTYAGAIISHGADPYLEDMANLLSFYYKCVCSTDVNLVQRLMSTEMVNISEGRPKNYLKNVFDRQVWANAEKNSEFSAFVAHLVSLPRKTYNGVMRAIRTYVAGMFRIADDVQVAYTLMVASVESLVQDFDGHNPDWQSVAEEKRLAIDAALAGVDQETNKGVKAAILKFENSMLSKRFRDFCIVNLDDSFYQGPFDEYAHPPGKSELNEVLANAYSIRSKYIHALKSLPDALTIGRNHAETALVKRQRMLTLQGLSRMMREVILNFAKKEELVEAESYPYFKELAGIIQAPMAGRYWVGDFSNGFVNHGRTKLEGFLEEAQGCLQRIKGAELPNVVELLGLFTKIAPSISPKQRKPFFAMLLIFNSFVPSKSVFVTKRTRDLINSDFKLPSIEGLLISAILHQGKEFWPIDVQLNTLSAYKKQRSKNAGIRLPRFFEAAISLSIAELCRISNDQRKCREVICDAQCDAPDFNGLKALLEKSAFDEKIGWQTSLLNIDVISGEATKASKSKIRHRVLRPQPIKIGKLKHL